MSSRISRTLGWWLLPALVLSAVLWATQAPPAASAASASAELGRNLVAAADDPMQEAWEATGAFIVGQGIPSPGEIGGDWAVVGLARAGYPLPDGFYEGYVDNVVGAVVQAGGVLSIYNYTEYSRAILGLTAVGADVTNVGGYNLLEKLADYENVVAQGVNGPAFALMALDSHDYAIPQVSGVPTQTTRQLLIDKILDLQIFGGGWSFLPTATEPDVDMTAMAVQALAPYYDTDPGAAMAIDRALAFFSSAQEPSGGYESLNSTNSESTAQVVVALTALGIDPLSDARFVKNGNSTLAALMGFYVEGGGFKHIMSGERDELATEQAYYALTAYYRFLLGQTSLFDMTDVVITPTLTPFFTDVPVGHAYFAAIQALADWGIVGGYPASGGGSEYRPGNPVLRAQVAKMLVIGFGLHDEEITDAGNPLFDDVTPSMGIPYPFDFVQEAALNGLVLGFTDGTFGPYVNVTRIQLLRMLVRGAGDQLAMPPVGYETGFTDVDPSDEEIVAIGKCNGIISGKSAQTFDPRGPATRGHFAKMLYNVLSD